VQFVPLELGGFTVLLTVFSELHKQYRYAADRLKHPINQANRLFVGGGLQATGRPETVESGIVDDNDRVSFH
jgi:hypothetical protein